MKKTIQILFSLFCLLLIASAVSAEEEINAIYGETYMCGDAYTMRIVAQPQMMAQISEKIGFYVYRRDPQTGRSVPYQINVRYGQQTEEDVMLLFRIQLRNLNPKTIEGLSPESFILTAKVRDRVLEYRPEVMTPFEISDDEWLYYLDAPDQYVYYMSRVLQDSITFDLADYWDPYMLSSKLFHSMRVWEIRLVYRVPSWLVGWDLHVNPQPMVADEELKTCDLTMHLPTIMNEITHETYKYIY